MAGVFGAVVLFFPSVARAMKVLDQLIIWKGLRQVGTDRDKVNQVTRITCSVGEEAGDIFLSFQLTDERDDEKVRDRCSAHFVPHIHRGWNKKRPEKHVCTFSLSLQAVKSVTEMETTDYFCATEWDQNNKTPTKK